MIVDFVVKNANIYTENGLFYGGMAIEQGKILAIEKDHLLPQGKQEVDLMEKLVIPGLVDLHVHFREPGSIHKEDFLTGTGGAAAGGITTVFDEPNNIPIINSPEAFELKKELVKDKALVDYNFNISLNSENLHQVPIFRELGIKSFAIFDEIVDTPTGLTHNGILYDALEQIKSVDGVAFFNCRESDMIDTMISRFRKNGQNSLDDYNQSYPVIAEAISAAKQFLLADDIGVKSHFREVSTLNSINVFRQLSHNTEISIEVRPDHLFLTQENSSHLGPLVQQWTPIRSKEHTEALWQALDEKTIHVIASDHATHTLEEKEAGIENIWNAPPGLPAIETMLPLLLTRVNREQLSLKRLVETTSTNPAKIMGLHPTKGALKIGSDADFVVIDMKRQSVIKGVDFHTKTKWTPFEGWKIKGIPIMTFLRGKKIYEDGVVIGTPGQGQYLTL